MKKSPDRTKGDQLKIDFIPKNNNAVNTNNAASGKVVNINDHSMKAFVSFIVKNSKSF